MPHFDLILSFPSDVNVSSNIFRKRSGICNSEGRVYSILRIAQMNILRMFSMLCKTSFDPQIKKAIGKLTKRRAAGSIADIGDSGTMTKNNNQE